MRTATLMRAVVQTVKAARERNPQLTYGARPATNAVLGPAIRAAASVQSDHVPRQCATP